MKYVRSVVTLWLCSIALLAAPSRAEAFPTARDPFWLQVRQLIDHCAVMPVRLEGSRRVASPMVSLCRELRVADGGAYFILGNSRYFAYLVESPDSDGGDLYHVRVINERRKLVAARDNVPAFGDVLLGLAGTSEGIREVMR